MRFKLFLLLALGMCLLSLKHEYHVSISQMDYNTESSTIQLSMKLHIEDVELLLEKNLEGVLNLEKDLEKKAVEAFLHDYIRTSFSLSQGAKQVEYKFVGREFEDDDLWMYMETAEFSEMPELEVKNTLFLELFHDQTNMVHYSKDNQVKQSTVLNKQKRSYLFSME